MAELFLELLSVALNGQIELSRIPSHGEWEQLYSIADKQALLGICYPAIRKLPNNQKPPCEIANMWLAQVGQVVQQGELHKRVLIEVSSYLKRKGIDVIFMKGLVCASRYPQPELRQCGDIDFVVSGDVYARTLQVLEEIGSVNYQLKHEHHGMAMVDGVLLEPHFKIHNFQNPKNDRVMRILQKEILEAPSVYINVDGNQIRKFPMEFEGMSLISHMVNHVFEEGLGLRQVLDYFFWLQAFEGDKDLFFSYLDRMQMRRAARVFGLIAESFLGLEQGKGCLEPPSDKESLFANQLFVDIMKVGNFGREFYRRKRDGIKDAFANYWWVTRRSFRLAYLCPSEAYWWPVGKLLRFLNKELWRIRGN